MATSRIHRRVSDKATDIKNMVLVLAWNECSQAGTTDAIGLKDLMYQKVQAWLDQFPADYGCVVKRYNGGYPGATDAERTAALMKEVKDVFTDADGDYMRMAKEVLRDIHKYLSPAWKDPMNPSETPSGKGWFGNLHDCRLACFAAKQEEKETKKRKEEGDQYVPPAEIAVMPSTWSPRFFLAFEKLGLPAGSGRCLNVLRVASGKGGAKKGKGKRARAPPESAEAADLRVKETGRKAARAALLDRQLAARGDPSAAQDHEDNAKALIAHENMTGAVLWAQNKDRLKELLTLAQEDAQDDPDDVSLKGAVTAAREAYRAHIQAPYVPKVYVPSGKAGKVADSEAEEESEGEDEGEDEDSPLTQRNLVNDDNDHPPNPPAGTESSSSRASSLA